MLRTRSYRHSAGRQGALVNACLVETSEPIVAVDRTSEPSRRRNHAKSEEE